LLKTLFAKTGDAGRLALSTPRPGGELFNRGGVLPSGVGGHGRTLVFIVAQFLAFARAGSMQAAAKAAGHQSTIQRRIAQLEENLGRRLVEPHGGGYRLTDLGEELQSTPGCRPGLSLLSSLPAPLVL
jgi:hypothetical protein